LRLSPLIRRFVRFRRTRLRLCASVRFNFFIICARGAGARMENDTISALDTARGERSNSHLIWLFLKRVIVTPAVDSRSSAGPRSDSDPAPTLERG